MAVMFIAIGILGITHYNSSGSELLRGLNKTFGGRNDIIPIVMAVIELVAGVLLFVSLFDLIPSRLLSFLLLVIFIFWAINIVMAYILNDIFEPDFLRWLAAISPQLVILSALWIVYRNYD